LKNIGGQSSGSLQITLALFGVAFLGIALAAFSAMQS
jgi:hypothetical protein